MANVFPGDHPFPISLIQFLGWLGDSGPGVFILASGFGLTWAAFHRPAEESRLLVFYQRRLLRLFPLYIAIHFLILTLSLFVPGSDITLASPKTLLSILGLRFADGLFFYINPSWWFIWLILQLYLVFPFLYALMQRLDIKKFLLITIAFTFLSRLLGILGVRYSDSLYFWMTGIFFGSRLAEFTVGMALAGYLLNCFRNKKEVPELRTILPAALLFYIAGLIASFTLPGSIISNLLVTIGMSGIFYTLWMGLINKIRLLEVLTSWIAAQSYGIYLIHQAPLRWTANYFAGDDSLHLFAAFFVLVFSFPLAWLMNKSVSGLRGIIFKSQKIPLRFVSWILGFAILGAMLFIDPRAWSLQQHNAYFLILGSLLVILCIAESVLFEEQKLAGYVFRWAMIFSSFFYIFLLFSFIGYFSIILGFLLCFFAIIIYRFYHIRVIAWSAALTVILFLSIALELIFGYFSPLEAGRWGEFPALQIHPTRTYSLKPNQKTRLRYNNYDYILRTNSLGLANPEIAIEKSDPNTKRILIIGGAFSMPEGMEYEHAYPSILQQKLKEALNPIPIEVINAGVTGYGPVEEYPQLKELLPLLKPDIVIYEFFINEFQEATLSAEDRLKGIGFIRQYRTSYQKLLSRSQAIANLKKFQSRLKESIKGAPERWRYFKSLLNYYATGENNIYSGESLAAIRHYLKSMNSVCQQFKAGFIIYFVPGAVAVSQPSDIAYFPAGQDVTDRSKYDLTRPLRNLHIIADPLGIPVVDLTPALKSHAAQPVYFPDSWHWNEEGHKVVAGVIAKDLLDRGLFSKNISANK